MKSEVKVNFDNSEAVVLALREFYRRVYKDGESDEAFLLWVERIVKFAK